jgi:hypothetical protein
LDTMGETACCVLDDAAKRDAEDDHSDSD